MSICAGHITLATGLAMSRSTSRCRQSPLLFLPSLGRAGLLERASEPFGASRRPLPAKGRVGVLATCTHCTKPGNGYPEGGGTQLAAARALALPLQGRRLYCVRPPRPSLQDSSGPGVVGWARRCLQRQNCRPAFTSAKTALVLSGSSPGRAIPPSVDTLLVVC